MYAQLRDIPCGWLGPIARSTCMHFFTFFDGVEFRYESPQVQSVRVFLFMFTIALPLMEAWQCSMPAIPAAPEMEEKSDPLGIPAAGLPRDWSIPVIVSHDDVQSEAADNCLPVVQSDPTPSATTSAYFNHASMPTLHHKHYQQWDFELFCSEPQERCR